LPRLERREPRRFDQPGDEVLIVRGGANEAFDAAADSTRFPEQLGPHIRPWRAKRDEEFKVDTAKLTFRWPPTVSMAVALRISV